MPPKKTGTKLKAARADETDVTQSLSRDQAFDREFYTESDDSDNSDWRGQLTQRGLLKRKRGRKPKRPVRGPAEVLAMSDHEEVLENVEPGEGRSIDVNVSLKLVAGLQGPELSINLADVIANGKFPISNLYHDTRLKVEAANAIEHSKETAKMKKNGISLTDLPPEIMIEIYRKLFVTPQEPIFFTRRANLARSGQLLNTCRQIYLEGSKVLYGENSFHFRRSQETRGTYYEKVWKEIGYKDIRRFFHDIGPHNIGKLKYISFDLEDALPSVTPYLDTQERKYANDLVLVEVLNMVAKYSDLEILCLGFKGSRSLNIRDYHILKAIGNFRCTEFVEDVRHGPSKIDRPTYLRMKKLVEVERPTKPDTNTDETNKNNKKRVPLMYKDSCIWTVLH